MVNISRYTGITFIAYSSETRFESEANDSVDCRFLKFSFVEGVVPVQPAKVDCVAKTFKNRICLWVGGGWDRCVGGISDKLTDENRYYVLNLL